MRQYLRRNLDLATFLGALGVVGLCLYVLPEATYRSSGTVLFRATFVTTIITLVLLVVTLPIYLADLVGTLKKEGRLVTVGLPLVLLAAFVIRFLLVEPFTPRYRNGLLFSPLNIMWHFELLTSNRPSGHPILVGLFNPGDSVTIFDAFTVNRALGALLILPVFSLLTHLTKRPTAGLVGACFVAADPLLIHLSRGAEQIVPGLFFATLALALLSRSESTEKGSRILFLGAAAALFLATTMRNELILLPLMFAALMSFQGRRDRYRRLALAIFAVVFTLVMAFQIAQFRFTGEWHLVLNDPAHTSATLLGFLSGSRADFEVMSLFRGFSVYVNDPPALGPLLALLPALPLTRRTRRFGLFLLVTYAFVWFVYTAARPGGIVRYDAALPAVHLVLLFAASAALVTGLSRGDSGRKGPVVAALVVVMAVSGPFYAIAGRVLAQPKDGESAQSCQSVASCQHFAAQFTRSSAQHIDDECFFFVDDNSALRVYAPIISQKLRRLRDISSMLAPGVCGARKEHDAAR